MTSEQDCKGVPDVANSASSIRELVCVIRTRSSLERAMGKFFVHAEYVAAAWARSLVRW